MKSFNLFNKVKKDVSYKLAVAGISTGLAVTGLTGCINKSSNIDDYQTYSDYVTSQCDDLGYDVFFSDYGVPFLHQFYCEDFNGDTIFCKDVDEFKERLSLSDNYTYNDIRQCFKSNKSIRDDYKKYILDGLDKMEKIFPDLDLTVLYYNAKRMKFATYDDKGYEYTYYAPACFDINTGEVLYDPSFEDLDAFTFCHEVLGHGAMECAVKDNDKVIYYGFLTPIIISDINSDLECYIIGSSYTEASADIIAKACSSENNDSIYEYATEELRLIRDICNINYTELFNIRGFSLLDKMHQYNIDDPSIYSFCSDEILDSYRALSGGELIDCPYISDVIEEMVIDAYEEDVNKEGIIDKAVSIMNNCEYDYIDLYYYDIDNNINTFDYYDHYESSIDVKDQLKDIKVLSKKK